MKPRLAKIHGSGHRLTATRKILLAQLNHERHPVSAEHLLGIVQNRGVTRSTVYRTMQMLVLEKLVEITEDTHHRRLFELVRMPHHHHLFCEQCGRVWNIRCEVTRKHMTSWKRQYGFHAARHTGDVYGLCIVCAEKKGTRE